MSDLPAFGPHDAVETLTHARASGVTSVELTERSLRTAEMLQSRGSRALTRIWRDEALAAAQREDGLFRPGARAPSLLAGLPVVVKDNFDVRGDITQAGSASLRDALPAATDAACVANLRSAGAVIIGKANMSEFAFANTGENKTFGTPTNPRDPTRLVGGSSSGSAAAVADGTVVAATGSDTGGSIRGPAALCGLVGFKPSEGRVPTKGVTPLSTTLDTVGPIARTVRCCAIVDAALTGDPWRPLPEFALGSVSFGVLQTLVLDGLDPEVAAAYGLALKVLRDAGAALTDFAWDELARPDWRQVYPTITHSDCYATMGRYAEQHADSIEPDVLRIILSGKSVSPQERADASAFRHRAVAEVHDILSPFHVAVLPTVPILAPLISTLSNPETAAKVEFLIGRNNEPANFFNCCAVTVPCQPSGELPVGLMMMARSGEDRRVLAIANAVQSILRARNLGL